MKTVAQTPLFALVVAVLVGSAGCMVQRPDRNYVQTNVVEKALFEGEWYYAHTIIDNDQESTYAWAFRGSVSNEVTNPFTLARIRFVIDEDWLYAFRSYPVVADADRTPSGGRDIDLYEPLAAWPIEEHFDIIRRYHPETGETLNVIEENTEERPWYERRYMRVDWAGNELVNAYNFNDLDVFDPLGLVTRQPAPTFVQEGSSFPEQWRPQFDFTAPREPEQDSLDWPFWDRYGPDRLFHFSYVTQEIWSPGWLPFFYEGVPATASLVSVRHAFLRVPDEPQYEAMPLPEESWERFGAWRVEQPTYLWGDLPDEEDGLSRFYGITDALKYWAGRHNIWRRSSVYDAAGRRISIPLADREVRPVRYTLSEHFPVWLIKPAFDVIAEWNAALMEVVRVIRGQQLPASIIPGSSCTSDRECTAAYGREYPFTYCQVPRAAAGPGAVGQCTRAYNPYQEPDTDLADFDCRVVDAAGNPPEDPGWNTSAFDDPVLQAQRGWRFVGSECVLTLRNNTCDDPVALARAVESRPACRQNPELCCDQMGDLRFNFLAHNDQVGVHWGGVSQPLMDPLTGELIQANANVAGVSVEGAMTYTGWYFDLVDGQQDDEDELSRMVGEDVRAMMEQTAYAVPPALPALPRNVWTTEPQQGGVRDARSASENMIPRLGKALQQAWATRGPDGRSSLLSDRLRSLAGQPLEQRLQSGLDGMLSLGLLPEDGFTTPTEEQLQQRSFFRRSGPQAQQEYEALRQRMSERNFYPSADQDVNSFLDNSFLNWLRDFPADMSPQQRAVAVGRQYFRGVMLHEMGHSLGMRHNFAGSLDYHNYHDQYYHIEDQFPLPMADDFDEDADGRLSYEELALFNAELQRVRERRELAGVARWHSASTMEYMPRISNDLAPLGRYDRGFMHFIYGSRVEVFTEDPQERAVGVSRQRDWLLRPDRSHRSFELYFTGGEPCRLERASDRGVVVRAHHEDCPFGILRPADPAARLCSADEDCAPVGMLCNSSGWCASPSLPRDQVVGQTCGPNPRAAQVENPSDLAGVCRSYQQAYEAYALWAQPDEATLRNLVVTRVGGNAAYAELAANDPSRLEREEEAVKRTYYSVFPVDYRFCSDDRTSDISWCSRFDEGESFREVMHHYRDAWVRSYPFSNFRRYRWNWWGSSNFATYSDIAKVMSHFYYRIFYENLWQVEGDVWVDSMTDHLAGAAAGMNFLAEVVSQPEMGSYAFDPQTNSYRLVSSGELDQGDLNVPLGLGRYMWSAFQEGPYGIDRLERLGSYQDKLAALIALARRQWGMSYSYDERFWINFYSMFSAEMAQLFGGLVLDDPVLYGARVCPAGHVHPLDPQAACEQTTLFYQDLWRGPFTSDPEDLRGNPYEDLYASLPSIGGGNSELLRTWAAVLSLAEFPIFWDTTYEQQLYLFVEGSGDAFNLRSCAQYPGEPDCMEEGTDFVRYFSNRLNLSFVATAVEPESADEPESLNTAFIIVRRARHLQADIESCENGLPGCPLPDDAQRPEQLRQLKRVLDQTESYLLTLLDLQASYGISSWL